jgi:hypothetical protein
MALLGSQLEPTKPVYGDCCEFPRRQRLPWVTKGSVAQLRRWAKPIEA